jgi:hypothetical protein
MSHTTSAALAAGAVALLAAVGWSHLRFREEKAEALKLLAAHGLGERNPRLAREVERETDPLAEALRRRRFLLLDETEAAIGQAEAYLAGGDRGRAGALLRGVIAGVPPDLTFAPLVERALALAPSGVPSPEERERLRGLLERYLEVCAWEECPLGTAAMDRLVEWVGELDYRTRALVLLARGRRIQAQQLVRRMEAPLATEEWDSYLRFLVRLEAAGEELDLDPATRRLLPASGTPSATWEPTEWRWRHGIARLALRPAGSDLTLDLLQVPSTGALVQASVDGSWLGLWPVESGTRIDLLLPPGTGPRLLELETVAGGRVIPGTVRASGPPHPGS